MEYLYEELKLPLRKIQVHIKRKIHTLYTFLHKAVPLLLPVSFNLCSQSATVPVVTE